MPALTDKDISTINATAGVVAENALAITTKFYGKMLTKNPELHHYFNAANQCKGMQAKALCDAVIEYALNIENLGNLGPLLDRICHRHVSLAILPEHYPIVHANLMEAIGEVLGKAVTPEIGEAWSNAVTFLAEVCIDKEKKLSAELGSRAGGWIGEQKFTLAERIDAATDVVSFNFKRSGYAGKFDFTPGQYLTLRLEKHAPRHYTITSKSGDDVLQCTMKKVDKGAVSTLAHTSLKAGDVVLLGIPAGAYKVHTADKPKILLSAGIGITTTKAFLQGHKGQVAHIVHVDRTEAHVPWLSDLRSCGVETEFFFTKESGRPGSKDLLKKSLAKATKDTEFYVCGPREWMTETSHYLASQGQTKIFTEVYGTGTVAKCPVSGQ